MFIDVTVQNGRVFAGQGWCPPPDSCADKLTGALGEDGTLWMISSGGGDHNVFSGKLSSARRTLEISGVFNSIEDRQAVSQGMGTYLFKLTKLD